jgi:predicted nucleic acid-binding protein
LKAIADTGFLVAVANRRDQYHDWAVDLLSVLQTPLLTCEAVLSETAFYLGSSRTALLMVESGMVRLAMSAEREWSELLRLAEQFDDQQPDLADLCVIRLSEIYPSHKVLKVDSLDFQVYRRNNLELIPLECPPSD